jgi:phospholipase C
LEQAGVSWKVYQQADNYGTNMLENFEPFRTAPPRSALYRKGVAKGPEGDFESDAMNDRLPTVSWIMPTAAQSEHPNYMPADGAAFVASKIDAIAANPEVWAKTVFILTYDENDGLFDHVAPPVPPPGTPHEFVGGLPIGAGYRVPTIIVSPWTAGGWVSSQLFDHTSSLRFLERITGVKETNITDWRRQTFGDFTSVFRFDDTKSDPPSLPDTTGQLARVRREAVSLPKPSLAAQPQAEPSQEKGTKRQVP